MKSQVSIIKCPTYNQAELFPKVKEAIELLGGISAFVKPRSKVLIKPNLLLEVKPETSITTHPEFVRAIVRILKGIDCRVSLGDSPSVFGDLKDVFKVYECTGMKRIAEEEAITLIGFNKSFKQDYFILAESSKEYDYMVNLPKFKTHEYMILTGAVKNLFGLIPGTFKLECHKNFHQPERFAKVLLDVYQAVRPALTIVDGISGIEGNGPATSGTKRDFGLIVAGVDCVAIDSVLARIMNIKAQYVYTNKEAAKRNLGNLAMEDIEVKGEGLSSCVIRDFKLPHTSLKQTIRNKLPQPVANMLKRMLTFHPQIDSDACRLCEACVKNCPQKIMSNKNGKIAIDYSQCISCFCCREVCPYAAIGIKKSLLAKMLGI